MIDDYELRLKTALKKQHEEVFDYRSETIKDKYREVINCPVCNCIDKIPKHKKDMFEFVECDSCGMVYLNPRLNNEATYAFYNSEWNSIYNEKKFDTNNWTLDNLDNKRDTDNLKLISKYKSEKGKLLEIGIGKGYFLKNASDFGYQVYGVELNKVNCEKANILLENKGKIINTDLISAKFENGLFDVIYMKDVFEHVPNPMEMLGEINRISKKGALLFIEVPNIDGAIFKITKEKHVTIFGFEHLNYWSPKTLSLAFNKNEFEVCDIEHQSDDFTIPYIISYLFFNSHTSLENKALNSIPKTILKILRIIFLIKPFKYFNMLSNSIVDKLKMGSQIKVIGLKK